MKLLALAAAAVVLAVVVVGVHAQSRQVPMFEPDPLWALALPN